MFIEDMGHLTATRSFWTVYVRIPENSGDQHGTEEGCRTPANQSDFSPPISHLVQTCGLSLAAATCVRPSRTVRLQFRDGVESSGTTISWEVP